MPTAPLSSRIRLLTVGICILLCLAWHWFGSPVPLANFSPLLALCFTAAWTMPHARFLALPLLLIVLSDVARGPSGFVTSAAWLLPSYAVYAACLAAGFFVKKSGAGLGRLVASLLGCSVMFYLVTNSASWLMDPFYAKTWSGWWQCLTVGQPGYPPTWQFFRNQVAGDVLFSLALLTAAGALYARRLRPEDGAVTTA